MKKYLVYILLILAPIASFSQTPPHVVEAKISSHPLRCCAELRPVLEKIRSLPEGEAVVQKILEEGPITIKLNNKLSKEFNGYWDSYNRTIYITYSKSTPLSVLLSTLLFEMHNALRSQDFDELDFLASKRQISKKDYVRSVEYIEFENVQAVGKILREGKATGLFPKNIEWNFPSNFEEHFKMQQQTGHSAFIAKSY